MKGLARSPRISRHAVRRFRERVDPCLTETEAELAIADLISRGKRRPTPRHWLRRGHREPGTQYIFSAGYPGVCLIASGEVGKTVLTRNTAIRHTRSHHAIRNGAERGPGG